MALKSKDNVRNFLKYSARRAYFDRFVASSLSDVYKILNSREPGDPAYIKVGKIDGDVICSALWREMSLNPQFFGTISPFVFNGVNNIFRFVESNPANLIVKEIRRKLAYFLQHNAGKNGQWNDVIVTDNRGDVPVLHTEYGVYHALKQLRDCIKVIAKQNVADYDSGHRESITAAVRACLAGAAENVAPTLPAPAPTPAAEIPVTVTEPSPDSTYLDEESDAAERERELLETFTPGHTVGFSPDIWQEYVQHMLFDRQY